MGTPRRAGPPYGLPAQATTQGGQFWTPIGGQYSTPVDSEPTNTRSEAPRWIGGIELTGEDKQANVGRDDLRPNTADTRVRKLGRDAFAEVDAHRANG
jgi:hypothetical protein